MPNADWMIHFASETGDGSFDQIFGIVFRVINAV